MKKILITFILSFVGFISFCSADYIDITLNSYAVCNDYRCQDVHIDIPEGTTGLEITSASNVYGDILNCFGTYRPGGLQLNTVLEYNYKVCYLPYLYSDITIRFYGATSQECPTIDTNYCVENSLCPSSDCPIYTGDSNWSSLYINDIQHEGAGTINITIPEEFNRDYTNENDVFDLDIEGYNVDTEYIDGIIRTQNYKPTSEDFTRLVGMLAPYSKYLIFLLFMFIIRAWIKKPFKSKKL